MPKLGPAKFAYVVLDVTRKHDPAVDVTHAPAPPAIGDVIVMPEDMGRAEYIREDDHGALVDIVHLHFVAIGRELPDGNVDFSYEGQRMLALLQIGSHYERAAHRLVDSVFEKFQEALERSGADPIGEDGLQRLRREFV